MDISQKISDFGPSSGWFYRRRRQLLFLLILFIAVGVRLYDFAVLPGGLNQDEASIGYDSWALLHYGIDRNGSTFPAHLIAWGSGQNVLYAYFSMPFIALFGLNVFSVRIVNLIFGILSVLVVYWMVTRFRGYKAGIASMALLAIAPWHIMLSRWGLESNLFPAMLLLSVWFYLKAADRRCFLPLSSLLFALTLYSYGSAYLVVTVFCLAGLIRLIYLKTVQLRWIFISLGIFLLLAFPIYLFVMINLFGWQTIQIGLLTIPHTYGSRITSITGFSVSGFFSNVYNNLFLQTDGSTRNAFPIFGCFYLISLPFCVFGLIKSVRMKTELDFALLVWTACAFMLFFVYSDTNINRVNSIYIPLIIYSAIGAVEMIRGKSAAISVMLAYAMMFTAFGCTYFGDDYRKDISEKFFYSFDSAILKAQEIADGQTVYVTDSVNMPYIYVLFYTQTPPQEYLDTVEIANRNAQFQKVNSFGNYVFSVSDAYEDVPGIYILKNDQIQEAVASRGAAFDQIYSFENYSVVVSE